MPVEFDLLGDEIPEGFGKRGRPPHRVSEEKRKLVIQLCAFDWDEEKIAGALGITPPTLRKHYFRELRSKREARFRVEGKLLVALMTEVEKGNVSAVKEYLKRLEKHDLKRVPAPAKAKPPKLGKKEQALVDAARAGEDTSWSSLLN